MTGFERISSAIIYALWDWDEPAGRASVNECVNFVNAQFGQMPDYLRPAFRALAQALNLLSLGVKGRPFCGLDALERREALEKWLKLPGPAKDFIRAYETLLQFYRRSLEEAAEKDGQGDA